MRRSSGNERVNGNTMGDYFEPHVRAAGFGSVALQARFDAERDTPWLVDALSAGCPAIRQILASLRESVPLGSHSAVGWCHSFFRLPNHYRSAGFVIPPVASGTDSPGVILFKGTEPLLPDFPDYLDWLLHASFRGKYLSAGLHFPLEMRLPPAAMWIDEATIEQETSSEVQSRYLQRHGRLARLPLPLFVYALTPEQTAPYVRVTRDKLSPGAFQRVEAKLADGLGVEVYYYPSLPIRVADLSSSEITPFLTAAPDPASLDDLFDRWIRLVAEVLHLGYMPFVPWNAVAGTFVDTGNACIDGGFNDLLTLTDFATIPHEHLFWRSMVLTQQALTSTILRTCVVSTKGAPTQSDMMVIAGSYVTGRLEHHVRALAQDHRPDPRLLAFFDRPSLDDVLRHIEESRRDKGSLTYRAVQLA